MQVFLAPTLATLDCWFWFVAGMGKEYLKPKAAAKTKATYAEVLQKQPNDDKKQKKRANGELFQVKPWKGALKKGQSHAKGQIPAEGTIPAKGTKTKR